MILLIEATACLVTIVELLARNISCVTSGAGAPHASVSTLEAISLATYLQNKPTIDSIALELKSPSIPSTPTSTRVDTHT